MNTLSRSRLFMAACALAAIAFSAPARAADVGRDPIILVAKRQLQDKLYGSTILIARPSAPTATSASSSTSRRR